MKDNQKIKDLIGKLDNFEKGAFPSKVDTQFEEVNSKMEQLRSEFNLEPLTTAINDIKTELETVKQSISDEINNQADELNGKFEGIRAIVEDLQNDDTNEQGVSSVSDAIAALESKFDGIIKSYDEKRSILEKQLQAIPGDFDKKITEIKGSITTYDPTSDKEELSANTLRLISELRSEFIDKLSKLGGGQADRNITFSGSVLTRYGDLNFPGATFTNDDAKKVSNVFLAGGVGKAVLALSANSATPAINTDLFNIVHITNQTAAITSFTTNLTGTPNDGATLRISVTGTQSIALTFGNSFESSGIVTLPTTTSGTTRLDMGFFWNTETSKWRIVALA